MPVEILSVAQRAEWERFPDEIDERALARCFSFPDDELEKIVERRGLHLRFAVAATVGALRWLGFVPPALGDLPEPAAAMIADQLGIQINDVDPGRLAPERHARAEQLAAGMAIADFRGWRAGDHDRLRHGCVSVRWSTRVRSGCCAMPWRRCVGSGSSVRG